MSDDRKTKLVFGQCRKSAVFSISFVLDASLSAELAILIALGDQPVYIKVDLLVTAEGFQQHCVPKCHFCHLLLSHWNRVEHSPDIHSVVFDIVHHLTNGGPTRIICGGSAR